MAGGEGTRLRPLTCDIPKPMARLCGRPVLEYILDLLIRHGVDEASVTIKYLPHIITEHFENNSYKNLKLNFIEEDKPLGTAGSVKNAGIEGSEQFIVISGDAMCDYDLTAAVQFHKKVNADATIVTAKVEDPREYGLVRTDEDGRVEGFIEKPGWGQAVCDTANTGIYILNPKCLSLIPDNAEFDFAKDLFPEMMKRKMALYGFQAEGYWCDIGDLGAYLRCQQDMLNGKVRCTMPAQLAQGIFVEDFLPQNDYHIIPPVYIGNQVEIANGAVIGPNTIVDDGCNIGKSAKVRSSVLLEDVYVSDNGSVTGSILCSGVSVKKGASMFEGSAAGAGAIIGTGASVNPYVLIWPGKSVEDSSIAAANVKYGMTKRQIFDDSGISGEMGVELTPETCARLGAAIGSTKAGTKTGIACQNSRTSRILKLALMSGLMSVGCHVWDFGECFEAQLSFFTSFCGLGTGIYVVDSSSGGIKMYGEGGLPLTRYLERDIESRFARAEFNRCSAENCRDIADMSSIHMIYQQELCHQAISGLEGMSVTVKSSNAETAALMEDCLKRLGCGLDGELTVNLNFSGTRISVTDKEAGLVPFEKLLAICCLDEFKKGCDVALPYDAPEVLNVLASQHGQKVLRYLSCPTDKSDIEARKLSIKQQWVRDGLFMTVKLLDIMKNRNADISQLLSELPMFSVVRTIVSLNISPSKLADILDSNEVEDNNGAPHEGITITRENGRLLISPARNGLKAKLMAEAADMETAQELCAEISGKITDTSLDRN